jgi:hypothetical protein
MKFVSRKIFTDTILSIDLVQKDTTKKDGQFPSGSNLQFAQGPTGFIHPTQIWSE